MPLAAPVRNPHLAEDCDDEFCPRLPCRMFKEGIRRGDEKGYDEGFAAGFAAGYSAGASSCGEG
jgi:hypothetical protein